MSNIQKYKLVYVLCRSDFDENNMAVSGATFSEQEADLWREKYGCFYYAFSVLDDNR